MTKEKKQILIRLIQEGILLQRGEEKSNKTPKLLFFSVVSLYRQ